MPNGVSERLRRAKTIGFLGFGKTNRALFRYFSTLFPFEAVIRDERSSLNDAPLGAKLFLGERCFDPPIEEAVIVSPSVRRERSEIGRLLLGAELVSSDAEIFFSDAPKNVIAITGSDGKSTTSALTGHILNTGGIKACVCGNFGTPMTPQKSGSDLFVTELSSFMLRYLEPTSKRAAITNVTPNHLNWHENMDEYRAAKAAIFTNALERVINYDCDVCRSLAKSGEYAVFSVDIPYKSLKNTVSAEHYFTYEHGSLTKDGSPIFRRSDLKLVGIHGVKNALLALALTDGLVTVEKAIEALGSFTGLRHRCELVGESGGVKYYDSSIDSTPNRTSMTLGAFDRRVTLILGGKDKGLSYLPLAEAVNEKAYAVILLGENSEKLAEFLRAKCSVPIFFASDMADAVRTAAALGQDTLLSPAATSYDRYRCFEERGDDFAAAVRRLK